MIGMKTARVVIVDDDLGEGAALLRSLSSQGIGAVFINEIPDDLPDEPICGVRILALDMMLNEAVNVESNISTLMSVVERILPQNAGPLIVLGWTKNRDVLDLLRAKISQERSDLHILEFIPLDKTEFRTSDETGKYVYNIERVVGELQAIVDQRAPFDLITNWEQCIHDAASSTVGSLSSLAPKGTLDWQSTMSRLLAQLACASGGKSVKKGMSTVRSLYDALSPIHQDQVELNYMSTDLRERFSDLDILPLLRDKTKATGQANLNTVLLTERVQVGDTTLQPGNIYSHLNKEEGRDESLFEIFGITLGSLASDVIDIGSNEHVRVLNDEIQALSENLAENADRIKELKGQKKVKEKEFRDEFSRQNVPVLLELTPSCDFAQNKNPVARFVAGYLVSETFRGNLKGAAIHLRILPSILFDKGHGLEKMLFVFNAHYLFGIETKNVKSQPILRLRKQVMVDIQAWFASHGARPGFVFLDERI